MEDHSLTVDELRKQLRGLPGETPVFYHRIEDVYFKKHGWKPDYTIANEYPEPSEEGEYIRAFSAFKRDGKLLITAHY